MPFVNQRSDHTPDRAGPRSLILLTWICLKSLQIVDFLPWLMLNIELKILGFGVSVSTCNRVRVT